jgi:hypothetical protein
MFSFYFGQKILLRNCKKNKKNILLFVDYIKFSLQYFNCYIFCFESFFFLQFLPLEFDLIFTSILFLILLIVIYFSLIPFLIEICFIYQIWSPFFWLLFILFKIIYKIRFFFLISSHPLSTFLYFKFNLYSFDWYLFYLK